MIIRILKSDIGHVTPINVSYDWYGEYFVRVWPSRPKHGHTKGHTYITAEDKQMIKITLTMERITKERRKQRH